MAKSNGTSVTNRFVIISTIFAVTMAAIALFFTPYIPGRQFFSSEPAGSIESQSQLCQAHGARLKILASKQCEEKQIYNMDTKFSHDDSA